MTTHDERVDAVARAMFHSTVKGRSYGWFVDPSAPKARAMILGASDLERMARAAIAALDAEPLEDVLGECLGCSPLTGMTIEIAQGNPGKFGAILLRDGAPIGVTSRGYTVAGAIRAAVDAAKESAHAE